MRDVEYSDKIFRAEGDSRLPLIVEGVSQDGYDENGNLLNILVYGYDSESEITVFDKSAPVKQLWYNELVSGEIYANPAVQVRKFIYENGALKRATSRDMYNNRSKTFIHKIIE